MIVIGIDFENRMTWSKQVDQRPIKTATDAFILAAEVGEVTPLDMDEVLVINGNKVEQFTREDADFEMDYYF